MSRKWTSRRVMSIETEGAIRYYRRKEDQAWEMAGLARQDGDKKDEERYTNEAREFHKLWLMARDS
jgi:hypothetical protein